MRQLLPKSQTKAKKRRRRRRSSKEIRNKNSFSFVGYKIYFIAVQSNRAIGRTMKKLFRLTCLILIFLLTVLLLLTYFSLLCLFPLLLPFFFLEKSLKMYTHTQIIIIITITRDIMHDERRQQLSPLSKSIKLEVSFTLGSLLVFVNYMHACKTCLLSCLLNTHMNL